MSVVVDTSAVLEMVLGKHEVLTERLSREELHAPHLLDAEFLHVLRRATLGGKISTLRAELAVEDFSSLPIQRYPHEPFNARVWTLRGNLTAYDATFISLAEALNVPLITCDAKLAAAPGNPARTEVFA